MKTDELIAEIESSIEAVEEVVQQAQREAQECSSLACEAASYASQAESYADDAYSQCCDAMQALDTLREEFSQLKERLEDEASESGSNSLQRDINRYKVRVIALHSMGKNVANIATQLEIGEFLVSRILELESSKAA